MLWNSIREQLSPARVVPLVIQIITAGVVAATGYLAANGFNLDPAIVTGIVAPIALGGLATALKWQDGWQKYEARGGAAGDAMADADVHPDDTIPDVTDLDSEGVKAAEAKLAARGGKRK